MRSLGDMPRIVIISEVLGMLLLVVAYLSINDFLSLRVRWAHRLLRLL